MAVTKVSSESARRLFILKDKLLVEVCVSIVGVLENPELTVITWDIFTLHWVVRQPIAARGIIESAILRSILNFRCRGLMLVPPRSIKAIQICGNSPSTVPIKASQPAFPTLAFLKNIERWSGEHLPQGCVSSSAAMGSFRLATKYLPNFRVLVLGSIEANFSKY